ncbi:unnamed protein product [Lactuca saligna]|uniref:Uncharacterized protein n=1 Tax=Lactuca saligna TaxID=75948 RepID=A0AA36EII8_LACSI|nr:unnamed protein product [Lactuca saligna]
MSSSSTARPPHDTIGPQCNTIGPPHNTTRPPSLFILETPSTTLSSLILLPDKERAREMEIKPSSSLVRKSRLQYPKPSRQRWHHKYDETLTYKGLEVTITCRSEAVFSDDISEGDRRLLQSSVSRKLWRWPEIIMVAGTMAIVVISLKLVWFHQFTHMNLN